MATARAALPARAGAPAPGPTAARDLHASMGALLLKAEKAGDSLERMLAVIRALLVFLTTVARPGARFADAPAPLLGEHYLSHRELPGQQHRGDAARAYLQELAAYDPADGLVEPAKYHAPGHADVARATLRAAPEARARARREGLVGAGGAPYLEVALGGGGRVDFPRHAEAYEVGPLPALVLGDPTAESSPLDFDGRLAVACAATGLRAELRFRPWREHKVTGEVARLSGEGASAVARLEGAWDAAIEATALEAPASGVVFDAADYSPPLEARFSLAAPGPRATPRLWSAILEAAMYAGAEGGRRAEALAAALPAAMRGSLAYEVPEGPKNAKPAANEGDAAAAAARRDRRPLPPAVRAQRAAGRAPRYELRYIVQAISQAALEAEAGGA